MNGIARVISALLILALLSIACDKVTAQNKLQPRDVVSSFYFAANEGKYSEAENLLSENTKAVLKSARGQMAGGFKGICDKNTHNRTLTKVEVTKEEVRGDHAIVFIKLTFKDGSTTANDRTALVNEKGAWKITIGT